MRKRLLLVGAGRWGKIFLRNLHMHPRARAAGVVSMQARSALPALEEDTELFKDFAQAMEHSWDGVILVTPPEIHAAQLEVCLRKGVPTLVEKPLALSLEKAVALEKLALSTGTPVLVDHVLLFHPGYEWLKANVRGAVRISSEGGNMGPYRAGYSPLWDYGAHDLSMALDFLGVEPSRVECSAQDQATVEGGQAGSYSVRLEFPGGVRSEFRVSNRSSVKIRNFSVETAKEKFLLEEFPVPRLLRDGQEIPLSPLKPLARLLDVFCDGLDGQFDSRWGLGLGVSVVRTLEACSKNS